MITSLFPKIRKIERTVEIKMFILVD